LILLVLLLLLLVLTKNITIQSDESSLTGEANSIKKNTTGDPFLLSSCLITQGEQCQALVIGIGMTVKVLLYILSII